MKLAWEAVATPHVLKELNWEGRLRKDRKEKKTGVKDWAITQQILGNCMRVRRSPKLTVNLFPGGVRAAFQQNPIKREDFAKFTQYALK